MCQRYYQTQTIALNGISTSGVSGFSFNTIMRAAPTITWSSGGVANRQYRIDTGAVYDVTSVTMFSFVGGLNYFYSFSPSGWAGGAGIGFTSNYVMSAELEMKIQTVKLCNDTNGNLNNLWITDDKGVGYVVPLNSENTDYQQYLAWIAEGNTPEAAD